MEICQIVTFEAYVGKDKRVYVSKAHEREFLYLTQGGQWKRWTREDAESQFIFKTRWMAYTTLCSVTPNKARVDFINGDET